MKFIRWCAGFFDSGKAQSMTRLVALLCVLIAAAYVYWTKRDANAAVVTALIGGGAVALLVRGKDTPTSRGDET